jgi:GTP diphosphokinase / guanosine-3',5'-bis(diphosphate) 3'-diphosphatase
MSTTSPGPSEMEDILQRAIMIAMSAHAGQKDKAGEPYIIHPMSVMYSMDTVEEKIVAVLHDVLEDTTVSDQDLKRQGIPEHLIEAIISVSRKKEEMYLEDFIPRVMKNEIGRKVKVKDIEHNLSRIDNLEGDNSKMKKRYLFALLILSHSIGING